MKKPLITAVVAIGKNRELGKGGKLLWHIPDDLKRFKRLTTGHPIIMGRKTFESIVGYIGGPLPGRTNIIVTRQANKFIADNPYLLIRANKQIVGHTNSSPQDGVIVVSSVEEGIEKAKELDAKEIHIGGGAEIYKQALPYPVQQPFYLLMSPAHRLPQPSGQALLLLPFYPRPVHR